MSTISEQQGIETVNSLTNDGKQEYLLYKENITFHKYHLKCNSCSWNVSYCEPSGCLDITQESVCCPVCRDGKIDSSKYPQYG